MPADPPEYNPEAVWEATRDPAFAAALFQLQADLPRIPRTAQGQVGTREYKYPPYDKILAKVRPVLVKHRFVWNTRPTLTVINDQVRFVLAYALTHLPTGGKDAGYFPLAEGAAQQQGAQISFAKRYALGAVLDLEIVGEDDDARPERDHVDEPRPRAEANGRAPKKQMSAPQKIAVHLKRLGVTDDAERLVKVSILAERDEPIASSKELSDETLDRIVDELAKCGNRAALDALLHSKVPAS